MTEDISERYRQARAWLAERPDFELRSPAEQAATIFPLERPATLLERLGRPDVRYRIMLVAGTKGKGSTAAFLAAMLESHGLSVGFYSQPHLHSFRERLRVDDALISPSDLAAGVEAVRPLVARIDAERPDLGLLTSYEVTTSLGLHWFAEREVDWAVLEVGLGGRLDATNVVRPAVAVITPISYDHMHILGRTLHEIAAEKAGIVKLEGQVVSAPQRPSALAVIRKVCRTRRARLTIVGESQNAPRAVNVRPLRVPAEICALPGEPYFRFDVLSTRRDYRDLEIHLGGAHQITNALTALTALQVAEDQGLLLNPQAVRRGLAVARWPGRLELVQTSPLLVLDGAHNGESAQRLLEAIHLHFEYDRLHVVLGAFADKDLGAILRPFREAASLTAVEVANPRARSVREIVQAAAKLGIHAQAEGDLKSGLEASLARAKRGDLVCVTGSLAVVAAAREAVGLAGSPPTR